MESKTIFLTLIGLAVVLEVVADILFKRWSLSNKNILFAVGLFIYFLGTVFWAFSLKYELLSKAGGIFTVINLIVLTLVGVLIFNENLTLLNKIGIGLGVISVVLMEL